jgi:hypothetical protein
VNQTPERSLKLARRVYSHHQYTLAIFIQFARLPAALLLRRHNVLAASATLRKSQIFPQARRQSPANFRCVCTRPPILSSSPRPPCRHAGCTGAVGPYRNRSRGPLVAQSCCRRCLSPLRHLLGDVCSCVSRVFEEQEAGRAVRPPAACSSQPAQDAIPIPCLSNLTSYHRSAKHAYDEIPNQLLKSVSNPVTRLATHQGKARPRSSRLSLPLS